MINSEATQSVNSVNYYLLFVQISYQRALSEKVKDKYWTRQLLISTVTVSEQLLN